MSGRILIVDDEVSVSRVLERLLKKFGYEPILAHSAEEAIVIIQKQKFDLLISDVRMSGVNGLELSRKFKEKFSQAKTILLTGLPTSESAQEAARDGVFEYLAKPFDNAAVVKAVQRCLDPAVLIGSAAPKKTTLIVEDDPAYLMLLKEIWRARGLGVIGVMDAVEALETLKENSQVAVCLIDIGLPRISGLDLCATIKQNRSRKAPFVALMTAAYRDHPNIDQEAKKSGADFFMFKPPNPFELCDQVEEFLGRPNQ